MKDQLRVRATLRIFGAPDHHDSLSSLPGFEGSHHDRSDTNVFGHDVWLLPAPDRSALPGDQCAALAHLVEPHVDALRAAIADADDADLCLSWFQVGGGGGGLAAIPHACLQILRTLPLGISLNVDVMTKPYRRRVLVRKPRRAGRRRR